MGVKRGSVGLGCGGVGDEGRDVVGVVVSSVVRVGIGLREEGPVECERPISCHGEGKADTDGHDGVGMDGLGRVGWK